MPTSWGEATAKVENPAIPLSLWRTVSTGPGMIGLEGSRLDRNTGATFTSTSIKQELRLPDGGWFGRICLSSRHNRRACSTIETPIIVKKQFNDWRAVNCGA